tara:strand:+ start:1647 stop:1913 length:267 start_codon:yes stop_codon:yes gene_type:complete
MDEDNFNEQDLPNFVLPESFLNQLFEFSGSTDGNRGFMLAFVNQSGSPMVYAKADSQIIEFGLRKAVEKYIIESEEAEHFDNGGDPLT